MLVELVDIVSVWTLLMALGDVVNTFCFRVFGPVSFPVATAMPEPLVKPMRWCGHPEVDRGTEPLGGHGRQRRPMSSRLASVALLCLRGMGELDCHLIRF